MVIQVIQDVGAPRGSPSERDRTNLRGDSEVRVQFLWRGFGEIPIQHDHQEVTASNGSARGKRPLRQVCITVGQIAAVQR